MTTANRQQQRGREVVVGEPLPAANNNRALPSRHYIGQRRESKQARQGVGEPITRAGKAQKQQHTLHHCRPANCSVNHHHTHHARAAAPDERRDAEGLFFQAVHAIDDRLTSLTLITQSCCWVSSRQFPDPPSGLRQIRGSGMNYSSSFSFHRK